MTWRRLAWIVILLLIVSIAWGAFALRRSYEELSSVRADDTSSVAAQLASLQERIDAHTYHLSGIEHRTLWDSESDFMSWVTKQADDTGVQIIGVEHLPAEDESDYRSVSVNVTIRGDYHPLGRFINQIERSSSVIRINSMRIHRKEYTPEHVVTDLSIAYFQKVVESL